MTDTIIATVSKGITMKPLYALPLILAACAPPVTCERVWRDTATGVYGCERPTATLPVRADHDGPDRPGDRPDHEPEHEPEHSDDH